MLHLFWQHGIHLFRPKGLDMIPKVDHITDLKSLFLELKKSDGYSIDPTGYPKIFFDQKREVPLIQLYKMMIEILEKNPHFSMKERAYGEQILEKFERIKKEKIAENNIDILNKIEKLHTCVFDKILSYSHFQWLTDFKSLDSRISHIT